MPITARGAAPLPPASAPLLAGYASAIPADGCTPVAAQAAGRSCASGMRLERPQKQRVSAQELPLKGLAVPIPQLFAADHPAHAALHQTPQNQGQRQIQPDQRVRLRPDDVTYFGVIPINHPPLSGQGLPHPLSENIQLRHRPVRPPVQSIHLYSWRAQPLAQLLGKGGLAHPRHAHHDDPPGRHPLRLAGVRNQAILPFHHEQRISSQCLHVRRRSGAPSSAHYTPTWPTRHLYPRSRPSPGYCPYI